MSSGPPARLAASHFLGQMLATAVGGHRRPVGVAIGRFADHVVEVRRRLRIGLEQLGVRADVAGGEHADRLAVSVMNSISIEAEPSRWPAFQ